MSNDLALVRVSRVLREVPGGDLVEQELWVNPARVTLIEADPKAPTLQGKSTCKLVVGDYEFWVLGQPHDLALLLTLDDPA